MSKLQFYRCHKVVQAFKVASIDRADGMARLSGQDTDGQPVLTVLDGHLVKDTETDLGYAVFYANGYASWSPSRAFEDGYSPVSDELPPNAVVFVPAARPEKTTRVHRMPME